MQIQGIDKLKSAENVKVWEDVKKCLLADKFASSFAKNNDQNIFISGLDNFCYWASLTSFSWSCVSLSNDVCNINHSQVIGTD